MPATPPPPPEKLKDWPDMTGWFSPCLLGKLLKRVIVSDIFGQYADRRLIMAALDPAPDKEFLARARQFMPDLPNEYWNFTPDNEGAVWIDFIADLGDGFDATYAMASLLSQQHLDVGGRSLPRGQALIMGGDEIYPLSEKGAYKAHLQDPYDWAFPDPHPNLLKGPPVFAIPGNHDWYDGLVQFLALFTRERSLHLGGWRSHQRRSYFALQLSEKWWFWAIDAQLDDDMDQPQKDYFVAIGKQMPENANVILCGPEPGWLYLSQATKSIDIIDYAAWIATDRCKGVRIPFVLSGDTHHYSRYEANDGETQFVTSGGGGAFLHPTHQLPDSISMVRGEKKLWLGGSRVTSLKLGRQGASEACYPTRSESFSILSGNALFAFRNFSFALLLGLLYYCLSIIPVSPMHQPFFLTAILSLGFFLYTAKQEGKSWLVGAISIINGAVHTLALIALANYFAAFNASHFPPNMWHHLSPALFAAEMIILGSLVAGQLYGLNLWITSGFLNLNHNDAFSSMRRDSHRHFLRMRFSGDEVQVFPIGLDSVPTRRRREWKANTANLGTPPPAYIADPPMRPRLIEQPFAIRVSRPAPKGS